MLTRKSIKVMFLGEVETSVRSGVKSRFGVLVFSTSKVIWTCFFFSLLEGRKGHNESLQMMFPKPKGLGIGKEWETIDELIYVSDISCLS